MAIYKPYFYRQKEKEGKVSVNSDTKTSKKTKEKTNEDYASEIAKKYGLDTENPTDLKARQKVKLPILTKKETPEIVRPQLKATPEGMNYGGRIAQDTSMPYATSQNKSVKGTLNLTQGQQIVKDMPRNLLAGIVSAANTLGKVAGTTGREFKTDRRVIDPLGNMTDEEYQKTKTEIEGRNTNTLKSRSIKEKAVENLQSEVTEKTPLYAKMVRGALLSTPTSALTSAMGGGLATAVSGAVANPMVVELARDTPMFANSYDDGLKEAKKMNLKGIDRQVYAVGQGLIETITERMSSYGLEAQLLGLGTATGKGLKEGSKEFMKSIIEEGGSEGIATIAGQLLKGEYGSKQSLEADLEEIMVAVGTGGIMGGGGTIGSLSGGVTYETIGTEGDKVIVQTSDGRIEPVNPEILVRYQIEQAKKVKATEIIPESNPTDTMPIQESTINQDELQPNNEVSTPKELKTVTESLNEVVGDTSKTEQVIEQPTEQVPEAKKVSLPKVKKQPYEMTLKQYQNDFLNNSKYGAKYKTDENLRTGKLKDLQIEWENKLIKQAEIGVIPERVMRDYVALYGEEQARRTFKGTLSKGMEAWEATQVNKMPKTTDFKKAAEDIKKSTPMPEQIEQVIEQPTEQAPETSELDKLKSWVANVEKNEIQKSSKQNKAKYDRAVAKIKALEKKVELPKVEIPTEVEYLSGETVEPTPEGKEVAFGTATNTFIEVNKRQHQVFLATDADGNKVYKTMGMFGEYQASTEKQLSEKIEKYYEEKKLERTKEREKELEQRKEIDEITDPYVKAFAEKLEARKEEPKKVQLPKVKTIKVSEYKGRATIAELQFRDKADDGSSQIGFKQVEGHSFEFIEGYPIVLVKVDGTWQTVDEKSGLLLRSNYKTRKEAIEDYAANVQKAHQKVVSDKKTFEGVIEKANEAKQRIALEEAQFSPEWLSDEIYRLQKERSNFMNTDRQNKALDNEIKVLEAKRKLVNAKAERAAETKEKLVSNKMEMTGTIIAPPIIPKTAYQDEMVGFSETKTSKVKSSLNNAEWVDGNSKEILNDNPMEYQAVTNNGDRRFARSKIESDFNATFEEMRTKVKEEKELSSKDWMTLKELQKTVQALQKENPEVSYEDDKNDIFNMMRTYSTSKGQGLQAMKDEMPRSERYYATETLEETVQDDIDKALNPSQKEDTKVAIQILDELFVEVERNKDGTFTMSDRNLDKLVEVVTENFKVHKKSRAVWERALKIDLKKERITKTQVLDKISEILKIPRLTTPEANAMMDALDNLQKTKKDSVDYWKAKTKLDDMIALSKADWIDKVNAWQVTAMLGNIPTAGRNQIGTFGAVGAIKPTSDIAAYFIDRIKNVHNNKVNIAPPILNPVNYVKYWGQGQYKIWYDFVNNVNTGSAIKGEDTDNSKYEVGSTRVFNNKVAHTYYRFTKALLSDYPHKLAIYNMEMDRISLGEAQAKEKKQKFNGTLQRQLVNDITEEYTFNNKTGLSKMLTSVVADINLLTGDRRLGLGTVLARFARTQMNIVNFTADHLGVDVLRQAVVGKRNSYKYGLENAAEMRQINMTKAQAKAISGVALLALGAWLSSHGIIIDEEEDEDKKKMLEAQGIKGAYLNTSALARYVMSILPGGKPIFDKSLGEIRDGDQPISILFAQPLATHLLMGSRLSKMQKGEGFIDVVGKFVQVFGESISDFVEMPMSRTIDTMTDDNLSGSQKFAKIFGGVLTGFIPSPIKKATQAFDPYSKKISRNAGEGFIQTVKTATLPVLRKQVPNWFDVTGKSVPYYNTDSKLGALLQAETYPWYGSTVEVDPDMKRMVEQYDKGTLDELPTALKDYFNSDGVKYELNATQHQKFQELYFKAFVQYSKTKSEPHDQAYKDAKAQILTELKKK